MFHLKSPPIYFASERETPTNVYSIRSGAKMTVSTSFSALIRHYASLVKPDGTNFTPKYGLDPNLTF